MSKSLNPFKLLGSYIGLIIILLLPLYYPDVWGGGSGALIPFGSLLYFSAGFIGSLIILFGIIMGFFLGYLTHLSFRKSIMRGLIVGFISLVIAQLYVAVMLFLIPGSQ